MNTQKFSTKHVARKLISIRKRGFRISLIRSRGSGRIIVATNGGATHAYRNLAKLRKTIIYHY